MSLCVNIEHKLEDSFQVVYEFQDVTGVFSTIFVITKYNDKLNAQV